MKQYQDYKKLYKIFLALLIIALPIGFSFAQSIDELNNKIKQKNEDIAKLEEEIKQYQGQLNDLGKQKSSLSSSIKELDITRKKLTADISVTQTKIDKTNLRLEELGSQIVDKESTITNDQRAVILAIQKTSELEDNSLVSTILSRNRFSDAWNDIDNMASLRESLRKNITELKEVKSDLEDTRDETTAAKNELLSLKNKLSDQKKIVDQNTAEKKKLLAQTQNSETTYQKLLAEQLARKDALEKEIQNYESQLKYILDPSKLPGRVLSWPLDSVYVTSPFGPRPGLSGGFHSGTDFRATVGTPVKAMSDGVILGVGDTDVSCYRASFGKWIFIKYSNGLSSTYGHLSLIKVISGKTVKRGEIVGYSGNTGYSTGPHLHVSVYPNDGVSVKTIPSKSCPGKTLTQPIAATNAYLDPMRYLPQL